MHKKFKWKEEAYLLLLLAKFFKLNVNLLLVFLIYRCQEVEG